MKPGDFIAIAIIVVIIGLAALYIYKAKKNGKKCIGCPDSGSCGSQSCHCCEGHAHEAEKPAEDEQPKSGQGGCNGNCAGCGLCGGNQNDQ